MEYSAHVSIYCEFLTNTIRELTQSFNEWHRFNITCSRSDNTIKRQLHKGQIWTNNELSHAHQLFPPVLSHRHQLVHPCHQPVSSQHARSSLVWHLWCVAQPWWYIGLMISTQRNIHTVVTRTEKTKISVPKVILTCTVFPKYSPFLSLSITDCHQQKEETK